MKSCTCFVPEQQILDSSKLKEFADDNLEFHENGCKFSQKVENTWIGRNCSERTIFPFPTVLRRLILHADKNKGLFWKALRCILSSRSLKHSIVCLQKISNTD